MKSNKTIQILFLFLLTIALSVIAGCSLTENIGSGEKTSNNASPAFSEKIQSQDASATPASIEKKYSMDEVAKHALPLDDCWIALHGKVYDVSKFGAKHAGGEAVYEGCGKDATELFETRPMGSKTPHSDKARGFLPNFEIGTLAE
jgi:cytochrome b involved in lipid metabolism